MTHNEHSIGGRAVIAHRWIPKHVENLLDAGCEDGNNTFLLSGKSDCTWGIDINRKGVERAQRTFPTINFSYCPIEQTPFADRFFDVIVMNDALEHVHNDTVALSELNRILKLGGQLIISTPHAGLFGFLDPANYKYFLGRKKEMHRHYSLARFRTILDHSNFSGHYHIEHVFRSGLFIGVLTMNLSVLLKRTVGERATGIILYPLFKLSSLEYWIPFGPLAYNIAISVRKS